LREDLPEVDKIRTGLDQVDKEKLFPRTTGGHRLKVWGKGCRGGDVKKIFLTQRVGMIWNWRITPLM